jgi:hypothetical protein
VEFLEANLFELDLAGVAFTLSAALILALGIKMAFKGFEWVSKVLLKA